jgi:hypothetical protein
MVPEIREHPPSTLTTSTADRLRGDVGDPEAPSINAKNIDDGPPSPHGGSALHPRSEMCVVNMHGYERQKVILHMGPTFPAPGTAMAYDP